MITANKHQSGDEAYSMTEKMNYDILLEKEDALGLFCFKKGIKDRGGEDILIDLWNSHPKGQKTEMKEHERKLAPIGREQMENLMSAYMDDHPLLCVENLDGLSSIGKILLWEVITPDQKDFILQSLKDSGE